MSFIIFAIQLFIIINSRNFNLIDCVCTLPTVLDENVWDSRRGIIIFSNNNSELSSGWDVSILSQTFTVFNCIESDGNHWLFQSTNKEHIYGPEYYGFYCVRYTKITDYSYYYYLDSDIETNAADVRIKFIEESIANAGVTISQVCNPTSGPSAEEFHVLVKENHQADVKQLLPAGLIGVYAYTVTDALSSVFCGSGSVWDACSIKTTISLNYTQCSTQICGSTDGEFYATKYVTSGSTSYVIIINGDSTTSTRFTCLAVSGSSVSSNPGSCEKGQVATSRTSDPASLLISLSVYDTCQSTPATPASPSYVMIIVGVVVALIVLIACVIGCIVYHKYKKKSRVQNGNEENANNPGNDPSAPNVVAGSQTPREINNSLQSIEKQVPPLNAEIH